MGLEPFSTHGVIQTPYTSLFVMAKQASMVDESQNDRVSSASDGSPLGWRTLVKADTSHLDGDGMLVVDKMTA